MDVVAAAQGVESHAIHLDRHRLFLPSHYDKVYPRIHPVAPRWTVLQWWPASDKGLSPHAPAGQARGEHPLSRSIVELAEAGEVISSVVNPTRAWNWTAYPTRSRTPSSVSAP